MSSRVKHGRPDHPPLITLYVSYNIENMSRWDSLSQDKRTEFRDYLGCIKLTEVRRLSFPPVPTEQRRSLPDVYVTMPSLPDVYVQMYMSQCLCHIESCWIPSAPERVSYLPPFTSYVDLKTQKTIEEFLDFTHNGLNPFTTS